MWTLALGLRSFAEQLVSKVHAAQIKENIDTVPENLDTTVK